MSPLDCYKRLMNRVGAKRKLRKRQKAAYLISELNGELNGELNSEIVCAIEF